jgi:hypothetical protein
MRSIWILSALLLSAAVGSTAHASVIQTGSAFTLDATNAPDNYTANTTFGGTISVDGGAAQLTTSQIVVNSTTEWDVFTLTTTNGSPIAGNTNAYWDITMSYVTSQNANFIGALDQWLYNGTPVSLTGSSIGGICCAVTNNPVTGGPGFFNDSFTPVLLSAGTQSNWDQIFVNPYSFVTSAGVPLDANGFTWAIELQVAATPLPAALPLFATGLGALGLLGWRKKRRTAAVAHS